MRLSIPKDYFTQDRVPPRLFLCTPSGKIMGELPAISTTLHPKWNSYSEISFEVPMRYVDVLTGENKVHPLYSKIESPRQVYLQGMNFFILQDIDDTSSDNDTKSITAFSAEYAVAGKYLNSFYINTGEIGSVEVTYNEQQYGLDYSTDMDSFYKLASGEFDTYESYYMQEYTDTDSYTYQQVEISDAEEYANYVSKNNDDSAQAHEKLYMKKFANVQFYNPNKKGLSLLHLVLDNIPEWKIGNVDQSLWRKERTFSQDRISVYDFLMQEVAETFGCVFEWDTLTHTLNVYEEAEDGITEDNEVQTRWGTDIYISKDNLASEIKTSYSADSIRTKLVVTGSDNLDIREVNLGRNEIMDLSFYHTLDWMEQDLFDKYSDYLEELQEAETGLDKYGLPSTKYPMAYTDAMRGWVSANNRWNDIVNAVPADGNVVLVGDEFKKLYCTYAPVDTAYAQVTITDSTKFVYQIYSDAKFATEITDIDDKTEYYVQGYRLQYIEADGRFQVMENMIPNSKTALVKKLNQYHVDEDTEANKTDNILLKMKNSASDVATVRIYDKRKVATEYDPNVQYYIKNSDGKFPDVSIDIKDATEFATQKTQYGDSLYTNDYYIQSIIVSGTHGTSEAPDEYSMSDWLKGTLTSEFMDLNGYNVTYIGTMGAYFVLAKDEKKTENLQDYGVNLLKEKHEIYTSIFQTQTEAMFSQEKYQCIVQDEEPDGDYKDGTRWLDTNSVPVVLKAYNSSTHSWTEISASLSEEDQKEYENYQRYMDNYDKLRSVQTVLVEKERQAEYCLNGYSVSDRTIVLNPIDGSLLEGNMYRAAEAHFKELTKTTGISYTITRVDMNQNLPLYTFTTSFDPIKYDKNTASFNAVTQYYTKTTTGAYARVSIDNQDEFNTYDGTTDAKTLYVITSGHVFAVYLKGTTPYVSYANSQGVYQMIMEYIRDKTEMNAFFSEDQWIRLSPFIKEDEFNDSNFLLTGYESEEERLKICTELMDAATKELKTICQPSLSFSMTMANILALPEFEPLFSQFQLGNFIRVAIRDGYVKRARLLEVNLNFDDLSDFSCTFGNLVTTRTEIDKHADLLAQAVSAGKTVAKSSSSWQKSVDKTNQLEESISNGLRDMALAVGSASGQAISWDATGMHFRKYKDGSTTEYEPEEIAIINNALVATNDSWVTSKAAFGKYTINGEERWGPIAEYVTADRIEGKMISGGSIEIGEGDTKFIVNSDGSVEIKSGGTNYINAMKEIDDAYRYQIVLTYDGSTIFSDISDSCTITCTVYDYNVPVTQTFIDNGATFSWIRTSSSGDGDMDWNNAHRYQTTNTLTITTDDIAKNATFSCNVIIDESKLQPAEDET